MCVTKCVRWDFKGLALGTAKAIQKKFMKYRNLKSNRKFSDFRCKGVLMVFLQPMLNIRGDFTKLCNWWWHTQRWAAVNVRNI